MKARQIIKDKWGDITDSKGTPYMWHIDMGIAYLNQKEADKPTLEAWCLHPLVQDYTNLEKNLKLLKGISTLGAVYAVEYRHQANWYSTHSNHSKHPRDTLLKSVKLMLEADKLQNYWNLKTNRQDHPKYRELCEYFHSWFFTLGIKPDDTFRAFKLFNELRGIYGKETGKNKIY